MTARRILRALAPLLAAAMLLSTTVAAHAEPLEDYASYAPESRCSPRAKPGTAFLGHWIVTTYGGGFGRIGEHCDAGTSEHQEGRAFDWMVSAASRTGRRAVDRFFDRILADRGDESDVWARRMGIMYLIWDDHMYAAWDGFEPKPYLSSSCPSRKKCSATLRHRNHVHMSLSRRAGFGLTSWFVDRLVRP
ncbi:MAG: hypothetical protein F2667_01600 [Actinobacteria bacterium]|uniref:Unannotated protein n=1 Tax=freshwater metagenome TaxID=449393 RepID=A0A6J6NS16_9ZZZZ|nr:hypothetical protein [Actinomycetota bacterium]